MSADSNDQRRRRSELSRRSFLARGAATAVAAPSLMAFLEACSKKTTGTGGAATAATATFSVASPEHPVKWPIYNDNKPIASGLTPEKGATVNVYTYTDYLDPKALKSFATKYKAYDLKVTITTFEDTTTALGKIRTGGVQADIFNPSYDQIGKMVTAKLIAPLNHSYIPNIANVWPTYANPFYDQEWQYTTPYLLYGTGIAWRTDLVSEDIATLTNPYDILWDPKYARKLSVLDDYRTCMGMVLSRNKLDINTHSSQDLALVHTQLSELNHTTMPKVNVTDYTDLPTKIVSLCQAWAGDAVNMLSYMPAGQSPDVLRYWGPSGPSAAVDNDLLVMLAQTKAPVATQLFLNHMMDYDVAISNFSFTGYQPPQNLITPDKLVADGFVPATMASAVVRQTDYEQGQHILELPPAVDSAWQAVWEQFKAGA